MEQEIKSEIWREEFETLLLKEQRRVLDYNRMRELADLLGFQKWSYEPYLSMKNIDGSLYVNSTMKVMETRASYLTDWNGWIKLRTVPISKKSIINKAKVILEIDPDIILLQEVENRESLIQFNESFFKGNQKTTYKELMHLQGNDGMGLGMGILLKKGFHIKSVKSFSNEKGQQGKILFKLIFISIKSKPLTIEQYSFCVVNWLPKTNQIYCVKIKQKRSQRFTRDYVQKDRKILL